jgi:hypothetical protein
VPVSSVVQHHGPPPSSSYPSRRIASTKRPAVSLLLTRRVMYRFDNNDSLKDMLRYTPPHGLCLIRLSASDEPQSQPLTCHGRFCKHPINVLVIDVPILPDMSLATRILLVSLVECLHQNSSNSLLTFYMIGHARPRLIGPRIIRTDAASYRTHMRRRTGAGSNLDHSANTTPRINYSNSRLLMLLIPFTMF